MAEVKEMLRPSEIAGSLGLTTGRVYQLIAAGALPAVRIGRAIWIPRMAWEGWLMAQSDRAMGAVRTGTQ
jgi:excisionase family DNA binding protein